MKKRLLYYQLLPYLKHKNALVIVGMRQVGKTTLLRQLFEQIDEPKIWFDLDNPLDQKVFEDIDYNVVYKRIASLVDGYGEKKRLNVFIDEIQNFPEVTVIIKYLIDHYKVKFVVTGSSSYYLKNLFPESLAGRKFLFELNPLHFQEYLYFNQVISEKEAIDKQDLKDMLNMDIALYSKYSTYYDEYLEFGGFPEVVVTESKALKKEVLKNIFKSFFEKDIRLLTDYKDVKDLRDLLILLVPRVGSMLDITKISSELGVDRVKVYSYLEFLQAIFIIRLLPKYSKSIDRSVAAGKKVYFADNGIISTISTVNKSQLFENSVVNQLANYGELSFYNKRNTAEIDVIVNKKTAIEIKTTATQKYLEDLDKVAESIGIKARLLVSKKFVDLDRVIYGLQL
jgi:uncharacterized protein